jgi:uncharacterized protein
MKFLFETLILCIFGITALFLYIEYWDDVKATFFSDEAHHTIYVGETAVTVTVADEYEERVRGLSGVKKLGDFEGKLFIFDTDAKHGIWMKDMLMPLDIIWIDKNLQVVHIEESVEPSTYPSQVFAPSADARFVLEMNARFVSSVRIGVGDRLLLSPSLLPDDIEQNLQNR